MTNLNSADKSVLARRGFLGSAVAASAALLIRQLANAGLAKPNLHVSAVQRYKDEDHAKSLRHSHCFKSVQNIVDYVTQHPLAETDVGSEVWHECATVSTMPFMTHAEQNLLMQINLHHWQKMLTDRYPANETPLLKVTEEMYKQSRVSGTMQKALIDYDWSKVVWLDINARNDQLTPMESLLSLLLAFFFGREIPHGSIVALVPATLPDQCGGAEQVEKFVKTVQSTCTMRHLLWNGSFNVSEDIRNLSAIRVEYLKEHCLTVAVCGLYGSTFIDVPIEYVSREWKQGNAESHCDYDSVSFAHRMDRFWVPHRDKIRQVLGEYKCQNYTDFV